MARSNSPSRYGLTLRRTSNDRTWLIDGTDIFVLYLVRAQGQVARGYAAMCPSMYSSGPTPAADWLERHDLSVRTTSFPTRDELLAVLAATAAADPMPANSRDPQGPVKVRRLGRFSYETLNGIWRLERVKPSGSSAWRATSLNQTTRSAPTLRALRVMLANLGEPDRRLT